MVANLGVQVPSNPYWRESNVNGNCGVRGPVGWKPLV